MTAARGSRGPFSAEVCRAKAVLPPGPCSPLAMLPVEPGKESSFRDVLTPPWSEGALRGLHYRVRILNAKQRGAEGVGVAVAAGSALPPLEAMRAAPGAGGGVTLRWQPLAEATGDRVLLRVVRGGESAAKRSETLAVEATAIDPGGAHDAGARLGVAQSYTAFRTRTARGGKQELMLNSAVVTVTVAANALPPPPSAPAGLEGVVNTLGTPEIDLVWQASDEPGVTGYVVYRAESGAALVAVTPQPISAFSFSDTAVRAGVRYRYRVAAVNSSGAAGPMSAEIERVVPAP
jgi:hypothetical protein